MKIGNTIYLDHQATTPVDQHVLTEMAPYFSEDFGNPHSADHLIGWRAAEAVETAADRVARLTGNDADEIVFTSGATEANNLALLGLGRSAAHGKRRRILVSTVEHKCVLAVSRVLEQQLGYRVEFLPVDRDGYINIDYLDATLDEDVLAVSIMAVNNEIGTIQDVRRIAAILRKVGAFFHCDAAQAPGAIEMSFLAECVDLLSLSAHKMYGPKGIGALLVRRGLEDRLEPLIYGGGQQRNLRSGTIPAALAVGMGSAAALLQSPSAERQRTTLGHRRDNFVSMLTALPWQVVLNGPPLEERHPGNANLAFAGFSAHDILNSLQPRLAASTGSACTSGIPEPSHVLKAIGLSPELREASIRFSLGKRTTDADLREAVAMISKTLSTLERAGIVHQ